MNAGAAPFVRCDRLSYLVPGSDPRWLASTAATLTAALAADGWRPGAQSPTGGQKLTKGMWEIDLTARLGALGAGTLPPEQWRSGCRAAGIDAIEIALPPNGAATGVTFDAPDPLGERGSEQGGWWRNISTRRFIAIVIVLLIMLTAFFVTRQEGLLSDADSGAPQTSRGSVEWADGTSQLPGAYVKIDYAPSGQDWEAVSLATNANGANDRGAWFLLQRTPSGVVNFGVETNYIKPALSSQKLIDRWSAEEDAARGGEIGEKVTHTRTRVDGRPAYSWVIHSKSGDWQRNVWVFGPERSYRFRCEGKPVKRDLVALRKRCDQFVHSAKFSREA